MSAIVAWLLAQGGPPLLTDDPGTPGDGVWEVNVALTVEKLSDATLWEAPLLDGNYGVGEHVQLKVEFPWLVLDEEGRSARSGLGNTTIGVKWRFLDEEKSGLSVSTYPQVEFNNPTSSDRRGLVETGTELFLPLEVQKDLGPFEVNAEVGFATREGGEDEWVWGIAFGREIAEGLELLAELHGGSDPRLHHGEVVYNVGFRWYFAERMTLLFSAGRRLLPDPDEPALIGYLGIQLMF